MRSFLRRLRANAKSYAILFLAIGFISFLGKITGQKYVALIIALAVACGWVFWSIGRILLLRKANAAFADGRFEEGLKICEKLMASHCEEPAVYLTASACHLGLYQPLKSVEFADRAIALDPENPWAFNNRAMARYLLNCLEESLGDCEQALKLAQEAPKRTVAHLLASEAMVLGRLGQLDKSISRSTESLELDPKCGPALVTRAYSYLCSKDTDRALADLESVAQLSPPGMLKGFMLSNRARVKLTMGDLHAALEDAIEALKCLPNDPAVLSTVALVKMRSGHNEDALLNLSRAIEIDPLYAEAYWFRHELYERAGRKEESESDRAIAEKYRYRSYLR